MSKGAEFDFVSPSFKVQEDVQGALIGASIMDNEIKTYIMGFEGKDFDKTRRYDIEGIKKERGIYATLCLGYSSRDTNVNYFIDDAGDVRIDPTLEIRR